MTDNRTENRGERDSDEHVGTYPDSVPDEWTRTLRVIVEADERSDESDTAHPTISFPDVDAAAAVFTDSTLALLRALNGHEPASIRETARVLDRLAAYNEVGRIQALVESDNKSTIEWGEQIYEHYRLQSYRPRETDVLRLLYDAGIAD